MSRLRRVGAAFVFSVVLGGGVFATSGNAYASHGWNSVTCGRLQAAIAAALGAGLTDLAAYLQSIYNANCL